MYTNNTIKERKVVEERIKRNGKYYTKLVKALNFILKGKTTKKQLLALIIPVIKKNNLKLERIVQRNKQVIYCWICEHINLFPNLESIITSTWPYEDDLSKYQTDDNDDFLSGFDYDDFL